MPITPVQDREGERSRRQTMAYRQRLVLFFVVVFAFGLVTVRTEIQQQRINDALHQSQIANSRVADNQYRECLIRNESTANLNKILDTIISAVRQAPLAPGFDEAERQRRIALYQNAKGALVDCGKDPTP